MRRDEMRASKCIQYNDNFKPNIELIIGSYAKYLPAPTTTIFWCTKSDNGRPWALTDPKSPASATPAVPYRTSSQHKYCNR